MLMSFHRLIHVLNMLGEVFNVRGQSGRVPTLKETERALLVDAIRELMSACGIKTEDLA